MHFLIIFLLVSCRGCSSCTPQLPDNDDDDDDDDVDTSEDTADTAEDTSEPPPCTVPEVEPNDSYEVAQELPMEAWACGTLLEEGDVEFLHFENQDAGWLRVWARGADFGSNADLQLVMTDESLEYSAINLAKPGSTDPEMVVPVPAGLSWYVTVADQYFGYGEYHDWKLIASMTKVPLDWSVEESDDNNSLAKGQYIGSGDRVFARIESSSDRDWYIVEIPDGKTLVSLRIEAWNFGSPLHAVLSLYGPGGADVLKETDHGDHASDLDPSFETDVSEAGEYGILVKSDEGSGSPLYWYVLEAVLETDPIDTGSIRKLEER